MGNIVLEKLRLECKVCYLMRMCIVFCHVHLIYVHSTFPGMSRACTHLSVHEDHVLNDTWCQSLDMTYQCVANKVMKIPTAINFAIIMAASKKFLADYLLKFPSNGEEHHLAHSSLEVVMDKFTIIASPNCRNFISGSKCLVVNEMGTLDNIMALKDHLGFKYIHNSRFTGQSKDKVFFLKMCVDLPKNGVDLVRYI